MTLHNSSYSINWNWTHTHTHTYVHVHVYAHAWPHRIKLTIPTIKKDEVFKGVIDFVIPRWCIFLPSPFIPRLLSNDISEWMERKTIDSFLNFSTRDTIRRKRYTTFFNNNNNNNFWLIDRSSFRDRIEFLKSRSKIKRRETLAQTSRRNTTQSITTIKNSPFFSRERTTITKKQKKERERKEMNAFIRIN